MKTWVCTVCGWVYDEAAGDPDYDLAAGVAFEDLPDIILSALKCFCFSVGNPV